MRIILVLAALFFLAMPAHAQSDPPALVDHWQARMTIIALQAVQIDSGCVLRAGDSLQEQMRMPTFQLASGGCGDVLNAGLMGARLSDLTARFPAFLSEASPRVVIVSGGTNDATPEHDTPEFLATWAQNFNLLLSQADAEEPTQVVVETITPVASSTNYSQTLINKMNAQIVALAANHPLDRVLNLAPYFTCSNGYAGSQYVADGVHLSRLGAWDKYWYEEILLSGQTLPAPSPGC
jgi:lysophospholipase L1-like esterase